MYYIIDLQLLNSSSFSVRKGCKGCKGCNLYGVLCNGNSTDIRQVYVGEIVLLMESLGYYGYYSFNAQTASSNQWKPLISKPRLESRPRKYYANLARVQPSKHLVPFGVAFSKACIFKTRAPRASGFFIPIGTTSKHTTCLWSWFMWLVARLLMARMARCQMAPMYNSELYNSLVIATQCIIKSYVTLETSKDHLYIIYGYGLPIPCTV